MKKKIEKKKEKKTKEKRLFLLKWQGVFDLQNSKYLTEQYMTEHDRTRSNMNREIIVFIFENKIGIFVFYTVVPWTKSYHVV
ncbi:hypothetical protein QL285_078563 [Trifolium repens]|nr:hypothetical protein QL285_078563 [Trifolium repens]